MAEIAKKIDRDQAKVSPEQQFENPQQVSDHAGLTRAEKLTILRNWAFNVRSRLDATSEGMAPDPNSQSSTNETNDDSEFLRSIEKIITSLEEQRLPLTEE